jgi:8-oxo-dGTP pyrophosphatase MutT (NUDIX family)
MEAARPPHRNSNGGSPFEGCPFEDFPFEDFPFEDFPFEDFPFEDFRFEDFRFEDLASTQRRLAVNRVHRGAAGAQDYQPMM